MKSVLSKELTSLRRDGRVAWTGGLFALLLIGAIALGIVEDRAYEQQRQEAALADRELWLQQGEKDPHSATHYGQYVFRPRSDLFWMDRGVDDLLGTASFLESHRVGKAKFSSVESRPWAPPFVDLSPSSLVLILLPLIAMVLGHSTWNGERKSGTLATAIASGADPRKLLRGKLLAVLSITGGLAGASALLGLFLMVAQARDITEGLARWGLLAAVYGVSTWIYSLIGVLASVLIRSPAKSLLAVLGCWAVTVILVPRAINSWANHAHVLPDQASLDAMVSEMREQGLDGDDPRSARRARLMEEVLQEYGVESLDDLPINYSGLALQSGEDYDNLIFDRVEAELQTYQRGRERIREWAYVFSPTAAARALSRLSAGTDQAHHAYFESQVEARRRFYVEALNNHLAFHTKGERKGTEELWRESSVGPIPVPPIGALMHHATKPALCLLGWLVLTLGWFLLAARRADRDPVTLGE